MNISQFPDEVQKRIEEWLEPPYDETTRHELRTRLEKSPNSLLDPFSKDLSFGTGGMRSIMGIGPNRMNIYTVRKATQGFANWILKTLINRPEKSVVIGYDCRHLSKDFAWEAARVLAGNGITAFVTSDLRPTPFVSFACRLKKSCGAIMITASHNPAEYNGYKVYGPDGAQVVAPADQEIVDQVSSITSQAAIKLASEDDPLIQHLGSADDEAYLRAIANLRLIRTDSNTEPLKITYTPLHGAGITLIPEGLVRWNFTDIEVVPQQEVPDGAFPTTPKPNPEESEALELGIALMKEHGRDILIASDPDADRTGVAVMHKGHPVILSGNEIAVICLDHILYTLKELTLTPKRSAAITTIVSTPLFCKIATSYGVTCFEVLTGFKYIAELIHKWEMSEEGYSYLFGAEESYGYLFGTHARDKDSVIAACLVSEIAQIAKNEGLTLVDRLNDIYKTHGLFREKQRSIAFEPGQDAEMKAFTDRFRSSPPSHIADIAITSIDDLLTPKGTLPPSNVIRIYLEDGSRLIIRPSGTEPKVKIYGSASAPYSHPLDEQIRTLDAHLDTLLASL